MTRLSKRDQIGLGLLVLLLPCLVYVFSTFEGRCLFHPDSSDYPENPMAAIANNPLRQVVKEIYFNTPDGQRLNGWFVPARNRKPTILFAHGNGGNIGDRYSMLLPFIQQGYGFLAFDYRGYGKSTGTPSEAGMYRDMQAASDYLAREKRIQPSEQIAMGESLGSAVAVEAATHIPFRAVILFSTLTNTPEVADYLQNRFGWGWLRIVPLHNIMQQRFDSLSRIKRIHAPLIVMHGDADTMMPLSMPRALYAQATSPNKKLLIIQQAGHNNVLMLGADRLIPVLDALLMDGQAAG